MLTIQQSNAWLADGIVSFVSHLEVNGAVIIQESQPLRALQISLFDRGNLSNDVAFEITTLHSSYSIALDFAARRRQSLGNLADLVLNVENEGYTATLPGAAWKTTGTKRDGLTSIITYAVRGGEFTVQSGGEGIVFGLPVILESAIDPLIIPAGTVATVGAGQVFFAREIDVLGELDLASTGEIYLIAN